MFALGQAGLTLGQAPITIAADFSAAPLALAESAMKTRLAAEGASNIEDV